MSEPVIRVENLGKKYRIEHQNRSAGYRALRDVLADSFSAARRFFRRPWQGGTTSTEEFWALKDVSFEVQDGDVVGIVGRNGAGKSTLLKVLSRITEPSKGRVKINGRIASLLEVGTGFHPELTGRENIYLNGSILGMKRREIQRKFDEIVAFAEVERFLDTPVKRYSSGMYTRLAFAVAAHLEPEILLVDEVLAVGDMTFQKKCLGRIGDITRAGRTVLFVSHNMAAIESICSRAVFMDGGVATNVSSVREAIRLYLGSKNESEVSFTNKPIQTASIRQDNEVLILSARYQVDYPLRLPCLGFVISDALGQPICGSNPLVAPPGEPVPSSSSGSVTVTIDSPKLQNGTYRLSLWFGDGADTSFAARDCILFEVVNMAKQITQPLSQVGPVVPSCHWVFDK